MLISEVYKNRIKSLAGIITEDKKEIITQKIGLPDFVAQWAENLSDKYAIWIADSFKKMIILDPKATKTTQQLHIKGGEKASKESIEKELASDKRNPAFDTYLESTIRTATPDYGYILDWLRNRGGGAVIETDKLDFKNLTYKEALARSTKWHKELEKIQGGQIDNEHGEIMLTFPDGFYWINSKKSKDAGEAKAAGHCGDCFSMGNLISLRKDRYPYISACLNEKNRVIGQMKGKANSKPKSNLHPYIIALLTDPKINIQFFDYKDSHKPENDFKLEDLSKDQLYNLVKIKPSLLTNQNFDKLNFNEDEIKYLIKNHPEVVPLKMFLKYTDFNELKEKVMSPDYIEKLVTVNKISELLKALINIGGKHQKLAAEALYRNPKIIEIFLSTKTDKGTNEKLINEYLEMLFSAGKEGKEYVRKLGIESNALENAYIKNDNPLGYIQKLVSAQGLFGPDSEKHALERMKSPEFKAKFVASADEAAYKQMISFVKGIFTK